MAIKYDDIFGKESHVDERRGYLLAYLKGELTATESETVERHLAECPACRFALVQLETTLKDILKQERELIERLWEENELSLKIAASQEADFNAKKAILRELGLWKE